MLLAFIYAWQRATCKFLKGPKHMGEIIATAKNLMFLGGAETSYCFETHFQFIPYVRVLWDWDYRPQLAQG